MFVPSFGRQIFITFLGKENARVEVDRVELS